MTPNNPKKKLVTAKIYEKNQNEINKIKGAALLRGDPEPTTAKIIDSALAAIQKHTGGMPTADDIKTPLERQVLAGIRKALDEPMDPDFRELLLRKWHLDGLPLHELKKSRARKNT